LIPNNQFSEPALTFQVAFQVFSAIRPVPADSACVREGQDDAAVVFQILCPDHDGIGRVPAEALRTIRRGHAYVSSVHGTDVRALFSTPTSLVFDI
jgi:hypothetical protein